MPIAPVETIGAWSDTEVIQDESATVDRSGLKCPESCVRRFVEAVPAATMTINSVGRVAVANAPAERMFGYPREQMSGLSVEMLVPERFRQDLRDIRAPFLFDARVRPMGSRRDLLGLRKDGSEFPLEFELNSIETAEGAMAIASVSEIVDRNGETARMRASLRAKDVQLGEIHHRVSNNLQLVYSLLGLQTARVSDPSTVGMLRETQNRVRSMAIVHQTLYGSNEFEQIDFGLFLDTLIPMLMATYRIDSERISIDLQVESANLPVAAAVPCGLIVNELITNAFKHAFHNRNKGEIRVSLARTSSGEAALRVADDGNGFPDRMDAANSNTLGLHLVRLLAEQIGGTVAIEQFNPTRVSVHFPIECQAGAGE